MSTSIPRGKPTAEVLAWMANLSAMDYDKHRREVAQMLGIQIKTLDDEVKAIRSQTGSSSTPSPFPEVKPWPKPVSLSGLLDEIDVTLKTFVVLGSDEAIACSLWVVHTYLFAQFGISPLLIINAPERACAKTLLQTVLAKLCCRPLSSANATLSALFRSIEKWKPTLFIDEADTFFRDNVELHGMVNAGYQRDGFLLRSEAVGDSFEPRLYSVYCAKSIAGIALERHLPDATMSRGIVVNLRRKLPHESVQRLRYVDHQIFVDIASKLTRFTIDHAVAIQTIRPSLPDRLNDRAQDNWEPLLAIAQYAGPEWLEKATNTALRLSGPDDTAASTGNELLADIQEVFRNKGVNRICSADLIEALVLDAEGPWAGYNRGKPISPRQLARLLAVYGIRSKTVRLGPYSTPKGYEYGQFADAFARYLSPPPDLPHPSNDAPSTMPTIGMDVSADPAGTCNAAPDPRRCNVSPQPDPDPEPEPVSENPPLRNGAETPDPFPDPESCGDAEEFEGLGEIGRGFIAPTDPSNH